MPSDLPFLLGLLLALGFWLLAIAFICAIGRVAIAMILADYRWHRHRAEANGIAHHRRMAQLQDRARG